MLRSLSRAAAPMTALALQSSAARADSTPSASGKPVHIGARSCAFASGAKGASSLSEMAHSCVSADGVRLNELDADDECALQHRLLGKSPYFTSISVN